MSGLFALVLLAWEGAPRCQEPDPGEPPGAEETAPNPPWEPEERLKAATEAFLSGDLDRARDAYVLLVADPNLEVTHPEVRREAQVYLAALDFNEGNQQTARNTFRSILLEDPDFRLDPFAHPPEMLAEFELMRVQVEAEIASAPPVLSPRRLNPLLLVVPGGLQLYNDQQAYGLVVLGGVVGLAAVTGGLNLRLRAMDEEPGEPDIHVLEEDKLRAEQLRLANNVAGWSGVALWGLTFLHGALVSVRTDGKASVSVVGPNVVVRW